MHNVTVLHLSYLHDCQDSRISGRHIAALKNDLRFNSIYWSKAVASIKNKWLRFPIYLIIVLAKIATKKQGKKIDLIVIHDPLLLIIAPFVFCFARVIFDAHEDLPLQIYNKIRNRYIAFTVSNISKVFLFVLSKFVVRTIVVVPAMVKKWYFKSTVLYPNYPIGVDLAQKTEVNPNYDFDFIYSGNLSAERGGELLKMFIKRAASAGYRTKVVTFETDYTRNLISGIEEQNNVKFKFNVPYSEMQREYANCRIGLCFLDLTPAYLESFPVKIIEYITVGIPFVSTSIPFAVSLVDKYSCGWILPRDSGDNKLSVMISQIMIEYEKCKESVNKNKGEIAMLIRFPLERYKRMLIAITRGLKM